MLRVRDEAKTPTPVEILSMSDSEIDETFGHWYVPKRNMRFVRRNALVALGNVGTTSDLGVLGGYLGHPDGLLREHAAWAVGSIGGPMATALLRSALGGESDRQVVDQITAALAASGSVGVYAESSHNPPPGSIEA